MSHLEKIVQNSIEKIRQKFDRVSEACFKFQDFEIRIFQFLEARRMCYDFSCFPVPALCIRLAKPLSPFIQLKKVDYHVCLEYHMEKIFINSSEAIR